VPYSVELLRKAEKFLRKAPQDAVERIEGRLGELAENPICDEKLEPPLEKLFDTLHD
jgi:mRNA-degrading endonuclease RelE of RelBE toxin-antitoxin system